MEWLLAPTELSPVEKCLAHDQGGIRAV